MSTKWLIERHSVRYKKSERFKTYCTNVCSDIKALFRANFFSKTLLNFSHRNYFYLQNIYSMQWSESGK